MLEPCTCSPSSRASSPGRPVGLGAVLLLWLRLLRRCLRLLLRCCLLLMLILLLLILEEDATQTITYFELVWEPYGVASPCASGEGGRPACLMGKHSKSAYVRRNVSSVHSHTLCGVSHLWSFCIFNKAS